MAGSSGALRELVAFLGFQVDDSGIKQGERSLDAFLGKAKAAAGALVGALGIEKLGEWLESQIQMGATLEHTSEMLGIGIDDLQRFQYAARTVGIANEDAAHALGIFNKTIGEAVGGNEEAAKTFAKLHVTLKNANGTTRATSDIMADAADAFSKLPGAAEKSDVAMKLFSRSGLRMIPIFNKGRAGLEALGAEFDATGGAMSEQFVRDAEEAEHQIVRFHATSQGLEHTLAAGLLPIVSDLAQWTGKVVMQIRDWTKNTHIARNVIIALTAAAAAAVLVWGIMNIEVLLVVAALALLALAVDDVITFFEGGNSVLGKFLDKLFGVGKSKEIAQQVRDAWKEVSDAFGKLWDAVKDLGPSLKDLFDTFTKNSGDVKDAKSGIQGIADAAVSLANALTSAVKEFNELTKKADQFAKDHPWVVHAFQRQLKQVSKGNVGAIGALTSVAGDLDEIVTGDASDVDPNAKNTPTVPQYNTVTPNLGGNIGTQNNSAQTNITINGATNPQATADAVKKKLEADDKAEQWATKAATRRGGY